MKNYSVEKILEQFAVITLGFLFFEVVFITLGYFAGITINQLTLPIYFFLYFGSLLIWKIKNSNMRIKSISIALSCVFLLASFLIGKTVFSHFYDTSFDGRGYHSLSILILTYGWNPIYQQQLPKSIPGFSPKTFVHYSDYSGELFTRGYPKALWMIQSSLYQVTKEFYSLSVTNFIIACIAISLLYVLLRKLKLPIVLSLLLSFLLSTELHFIIQFFTLMQDGFSYELTLCAIALLGIFIIDKSKISLFGFIIASLFLAGIKFSNLPILIILVGIFSFLWIKGDIIFFGIKKNILLILACLLFLFIPYMINTIYYNSPIYPSNLSGVSESYEKDGIPANIKDANKFTLLFYGVFSSINKLGYKDSRQNITQLKIPFTFSKIELDNLVTFGTNISSYGIFFSGAIILSLILLTLFYKYNPKKRQYLYLSFILIILLFASALLSPVPNVSRYNTQLFIIPFITVVLIFSLNKNKLIYSLGLILTLVLTVNNSVFIYQFISLQPQIIQGVNNQLRFLKQTDKIYDVSPIIGKNQSFLSDYIRLEESGVPIVIVSKIQCKNPIILNYTYSATKICPVKN